jgi:hypothetical protein
MVVHDKARLLSAVRNAHRQLLAPDRASVDTTLQQIVCCAVDTVEPAVGAGITRTGQGSVHSAYATSDDVAALDQLQSRLQQGPCVSAAAHAPAHGVVYARDLGGRERDVWPAFAPQATALGYRSMLSLRLSDHPDWGSSLNFYARERDAFDETARITACLFSLQAATVLHGARHAENLQRPLLTRDLLGQAKGVLIERFHIGDDAAFRMLVSASRDAEITLVDIARGVLDDAQRPRRGPISDARIS